MSAHASGSHAAIRSAVRAAEALCSLPATPTLDWCERAARAFMSLRPPSIAMVMFAKLGDSGAVARVEVAGVAGCSVAEVSTTFGRVHSVNSIVPLGATHPATGSVRSGAHTCTALGWSPSSAASEGPGHVALHAAALGQPAMAPTSPLSVRWGGSGATDFVVGAVPLVSDEPGRYAIVEIGLLGQGSVATAEDGALLGEMLPLLVRRAAVAFGGASYNESTCLTIREEAILQHIIDGKSVRRIATELDRSPHTVHDHVKSLHRKLNASTRGALVARAFGHLGAEKARPPRSRAAVKEPAQDGKSPVITLTMPQQGDAMRTR